MIDFPSINFVLILNPESKNVTIEDVLSLTWSKQVYDKLKVENVQIKNGILFQMGETEESLRDGQKYLNQLITIKKWGVKRLICDAPLPPFPTRRIKKPLFKVGKPVNSLLSSIINIFV